MSQRDHDRAPTSPVVVTIAYSFVPIAPGVAALWGGAVGIGMSTSSSMYVELGAPPCAS